MTTPFQISDRFTDQWADLSAIDATMHGIPGRDDLATDYSPEGHEARADLYRSTREALTPHLDHPDAVEAMAARVLIGWLDTRLRQHAEGKWRQDLNHISSPFQHMRDVFDVMARGEASSWEAVVARLQAFPSMLGGYRRSLEEGLGAGEAVARRQAESVKGQLREAAGGASRFAGFPREAEKVGADPEWVATAVEVARGACAEMAEWVETTYLLRTTDRDAVGRERYVHGAEEFLGTIIDPDETYEWGWSEVHRIRDDMARTAAEVVPDLDVGAVIELLDNDPGRSAATRQEFVDFVHALQEQAITQLDGAHFDVPDELKTVTVNIAPPGGALGAWYVGPSEDGARPGSIWYAPGEREQLPLWQEVSTAYHEGFPGHHLQVGTAILERQNLSRFHRIGIWYAGSGEGWALYAERLMDELGYFEKPEYRLGLLASQLFRAVRVVVDIGCQLEKEIPADAPLHAGATWGYEEAVDYMEKVGLQPRDVSESEVKRYLGWWGQAISYKVGERAILEVREEARRRPGFDRKGFHHKMLHAGAIRLDDMREVLL